MTDDLTGPRIYRIIRFHFGKRPRAVRGHSRLTLAEARRHCARPETHGGAGTRRWFDGYDLMPGCRDRELAP